MPCLLSLQGGEDEEGEEERSPRGGCRFHTGPFCDETPDPAAA
jgi:hypothetical protein